MALLSLLKSVARLAVRAIPASVPAAISSSAAVLGTVAACGAIENRNALASINDIAHIFYDQQAFQAGSSTLCARNLRRYTLPAILWNTFALWGWAILHQMIVEMLPGRSREKRGTRGKARARSLAAASVVSLVAYVVDYKLVSPRWTPGIEAHLSGRSLLAAYVALALGLAVGRRGE